MFRDRFVHHRQLLLRGAKDYGFVYAMINRVILLSILIKQWWPDVSITTAGIISISMALGELSFQWALGVSLLRTRIIGKTFEWGNIHNPLFKRLERFLKNRGF